MIIVILYQVSKCTFLAFWLDEESSRGDVYHVDRINKINSNVYHVTHGNK